MRVTVTVMGHTAAYFPQGGRTHTLDVPEALPLEAIIRLLGADPQLILRALVDGEPSSLDRVPPDGASIVLISPAAGG
ncbi:MAG: hypothetical protein RDU89_00250 [bacterium]|nr:hypothetical protein [bacterium]